MPRLTDRAWRLGYRLAYFVAVRVFALCRIRLRGVFVLIWHGDALLLVKNSYKQRYSLPGGLLKRGETPVAGGVRETWEEVGVRLAPEQLRHCREITDSIGGRATFIEVRLAERPAVRIDQREIVWADFVPLAEARAMPLGKEIAEYLAHPSPATAPPTGPVGGDGR
jgi:8-oxo-dGTP pyrophosphatase MutT (NUDIX family)